MRFLMASRVQLEVGVDLDPDDCPDLEKVLERQRGDIRRVCGVVSWKRGSYDY